MPSEDLRRLVKACAGDWDWAGPRAHRRPRRRRPRAGRRRPAALDSRPNEGCHDAAPAENGHRNTQSVGRARGLAPARRGAQRPAESSTPRTVPDDIDIRSSPQRERAEGETRRGMPCPRGADRRLVQRVGHATYGGRDGARDQEQTVDPQSVVPRSNGTDRGGHDVHHPRGGETVHSACRTSRGGSTGAASPATAGSSG